jgi:outer membrane protein assembly factor BamA
VYVDYNTQLANSNKTIAGRTTFNVGWDARYYYPIFQNFIWAGRAAADFSWGDKKIVYYLGGQDGWLFPKANNEVQPQDPDYAFQALAVNMRGHRQNITNGNNAVVLNSEFRFPVFTTLLKRPINNAFLRNFQLVQFVDLGTAWNGSYNGIQRPSRVYQEGNVLVKIKAGGVGPFVGGYGFGARSTLLGYFLRLDTGWEMNGVFKGKPIWHFAMGIDF